jgi:hypothetical protein
MRDHKAMLDTASCTVQLDSLDYGVVVLQLSSPSRTTPSLHHTTAQKLEDIRVACEFPDVFPEDLSGMPPNVGQRVYPSEFFTLGLSSIVCEEERSIFEVVY